MVPPRKIFILIIYVGNSKLFVKDNILQRILNTSISSKSECFVKNLKDKDKGNIRRNQILKKIDIQLGISIINLNCLTIKNAISRNLLKEFRDVLNNLRMK